MSSLTIYGNGCKLHDASSWLAPQPAPILIENPHEPIVFLLGEENISANKTSQHSTSVAHNYTLPIQGDLIS